MQDTRRKRLGQLVLRARTAKGYKNRRAFAAAAGISPRSIDSVEVGNHVGPKTLDAVERALGWEPGSAERILRGDDEDERETAVADAPIPGTLAWFRELRATVPEKKFYEIVDQLTRAQADEISRLTSSTRDEQ